MRLSIDADLCCFVTFFVCFFVCVATDTAFYIGRIESYSCSACSHRSQDASHLILHCPAMGSLQISFCTVTHCKVTLCLFATLVLGLGELFDFWGSMVFCHAPILRKRSGKNESSNTQVYFLPVLHGGNLNHLYYEVLGFSWFLGASDTNWQCSCSAPLCWLLK